MARETARTMVIEITQFDGKWRIHIDEKFQFEDLDDMKNHLEKFLTTKQDKGNLRIINDGI